MGWPDAYEPVPKLWLAVSKAAGTMTTDEEKAQAPVNPVIGHPVPATGDHADLTHKFP